MPSSGPGGRALHRHRTSYRNATFQLDNPGLIVGAYLEAIPVLNAATPEDPGVDLPETELSLDVRAHAWILGQESKESWL